MGYIFNGREVALRKAEVTQVGKWSKALNTVYALVEEGKRAQLWKVVHSHDLRGQ